MMLLIMDMHQNVIQHHASPDDPYSYLVIYFIITVYSYPTVVQPVLVFINLFC